MLQFTIQEEHTQWQQAEFRPYAASFIPDIHCQVLHRRFIIIIIPSHFDFFGTTLAWRTAAVLVVSLPDSSAWAVLSAPLGRKHRHDAHLY